jgi:hypothetical protein
MRQGFLLFFPERERISCSRSSGTARERVIVARSLSATQFFVCSLALRLVAASAFRPFSTFVPGRFF